LAEELTSRQVEERAVAKEEEAARMAAELTAKEEEEAEAAAAVAKKNEEDAEQLRLAEELASRQAEERAVAEEEKAARMAAELAAKEEAEAAVELASPAILSRGRSRANTFQDQAVKAERKCFNEHLFRFSSGTVATAVGLSKDDEGRKKFRLWMSDPTNHNTKKMEQVRMFCDLLRSRWLVVYS
jgi:hypothetical protein